MTAKQQAQNSEEQVVYTRLEHATGTGHVLILPVGHMGDELYMNQFSPVHLLCRTDHLPGMRSLAATRSAAECCTQDSKASCR